MESESGSHGKCEGSSQHDSFSTNSNSMVPSSHKNSFEVNSIFSNSHKRAKSLKASLRNANISFPELYVSITSTLDPLPEPVKEDESENNYVYFQCKTRIIEGKEIHAD